MRREKKRRDQEKTSEQDLESTANSNLIVDTVTMKVKGDRPHHYPSLDTLDGNACICPVPKLIQNFAKYILYMPDILLQFVFRYYRRGSQEPVS